jgi:hypothetical protein
VDAWRLKRSEVSYLGTLRKILVIESKRDMSKVGAEDVKHRTRRKDCRSTKEGPGGLVVFPGLNELIEKLDVVC